MRVITCKETVKCLTLFSNLELLNLKYPSFLLLIFLIHLAWDLETVQDDSLMCLHLGNYIIFGWMPVKYSQQVKELLLGQSAVEQGITKCLMTKNNKIDKH